MQVVNCDGGCGKSELTSIVEKNRDIKSVKFSITIDSRETMSNSNEVHEADLCGDCRAILLNRYFRVKEGRILEVPSFLKEVG